MSTRAEQNLERPKAMFNWTTTACVLCSVALPACYTTSVMTSSPAGPEIQDRQWFLLYGLANVSDPAGRECSEGVAWSETKFGAGDFLLSVGMTVATGFALSQACDNNACTVSAWSAAPTLAGLLSSRTVTYACARSPAPKYSPPPRREPPSPPRPRPTAVTPRPPPTEETEDAEPPRPEPDRSPAKAPPKAGKRMADEECFESDFCQKYGKCASDGTKCVANSDAGCKQSLMCSAMGKCVARGGECVKK